VTSDSVVLRTQRRELARLRKENSKLRRELASLQIDHEQAVQKIDKFREIFENQKSYIKLEEETEG
jgi:hypothetical protein